ncbi:MAG: HD domain-containing protein [Anaerolineales bacterium]|jgi:tRNA nucleotidyltransferase/poly(A) polymerase|nr:HD domain-containing protein [Anaerolineales bacterium]
MSLSSEPPPIPSAYAGRWVALVRGQVVAQAETREAAFLAARAIRPKEPLDLIFMSETPSIFNSPLLQTLRQHLPADLPVYLVGGALRDSILGRETHDLDFAVPKDALKLARKLADQLSAAFYPLDQDNDTARLVIIRSDGARDILDFAGFRGETLEDDLRGRDFTVGAVALDLHSGQIHDPLGGLADLRAKRLRACAETSLADDPVRILRAIRLAGAYRLKIDAPTRQQMKASVAGLAAISAERIRDEFLKILAGPQPDTALRALEMLGVLPYILPELSALKGVEQSPPHVQDVWSHTLSVLRHLENILDLLGPQYDEQKSNADLYNGLLVLKLGRYRAQLAEHLAQKLNLERPLRALLFLAALYHDAEKPATRTVEPGGRIRFFDHDDKGAQTILRRAIALRLSNDEMDRVKAVVAHHMRIHAYTDSLRRGQSLSRRTIYRFFREAGPAGVDIVLHSLADLRATYEHGLPQEVWAAELDICRALLEAYWETPEQVVRPPQLLNGNDLIHELGLTPGRQIGQLLEAIRESQVEGQITSRAEALDFARRWLQEKKGIKK